MSQNQASKGDHDVNIPLYRSHPGTLRISGSTTPRKAGLCAFHYLHENVPSIEFLAIGANANHNATKAMGIFLLKVEEEMRGEVTISFQPRRYKTIVDEAGKSVPKDCVVWETVIHIPSEIANDEPEKKEEEGGTNPKTS